MMRLKRIKENAQGYMTYQDQESGKYYIDLNQSYDSSTSGPSGWILKDCAMYITSQTKTP